LFLGHSPPVGRVASIAGRASCIQR
jgi:hypothetical protein